MPSHSKILIVTHVFPPAGGIAVQRPLSFAKYLPQCGLEVHVLTARNPGVPVIDEGLLRHVPASVQVHRSFTPEVPFAWRQRVWNRIAPKPKPAASPSQPTPAASSSGGWKKQMAGMVRRLLTPDPEVVWVPFAIRSASRIIERHGIDTILLTAPPFSVFLTGNALKRRFPHLTVVSDFRDEWLNFYLSTFDFHSSPEIRRKAARMERETIEASDLVITVTPSILNELRQRYPEFPGRFHLLPNGYDPESFASFRPRPHGGSSILVTYVGTIYKASTPRFYLDALESLPESARVLFETRFIGRVAEDEKASFANRTSRIEMLGFRPQAEALRTMEETDYLLLTMTDAGSLTGKLFEYLATGKPILAFAPSGGEIDQILKETGAGWCLDPSRPEQARSLLEQLVLKRQNGGEPFQTNREVIARFERPRLTAALADLIRATRQSSSY